MPENADLNPDLEETLDVERLQQKISQLQSDLITAENKVSEYWDLVLRNKAETENVRKRAKLDIEGAHQYGTEKFARSLLSVVDSLEKGIESANNMDDGQTTNINNLVTSLKEGMDLTLKLLLDVLGQFNIKVINPLGETFNPIQHEALSMQENNDVINNTVLLVIQKGFTMHERVLRPARVIVAKSINKENYNGKM